MKKYLIIRFSSIGDIVLTSPVIRCLKTQVDCKIHYITKRVYASILEQNPSIDTVYTIEKEIDEVITALKAEQYDFVIDLHNNLRSLRLKQKLGVPSARFPKLNLKKFILTQFKIDRLPKVHIVDRYFEAVKQLGVVNDQKGLDFFIPPTTEVDFLKFGIPPHFIAFSIGAQFATKRMPNSKLIELIGKIDKTVVLLGGPTDAENGDLISDATKNTINLCGKLSLHESAYVLQHAQKVITHDTGLMHIASAFDKEIISIWGNTTPAFGMYPYLPRSNNYTIHEVKLGCRPCSKIGYNTCPKKHFNCMHQQDVEAIAKNATD